MEFKDCVNYSKCRVKLLIGPKYKEAGEEERQCLHLYGATMIFFNELVKLQEEKGDPKEKNN